MFDSLSDQMKHGLAGAETATQRAMKWLAVAVASVVLFSGLYLAVRMVE